MPEQPFTVNQFGGLDLFRDPTEVGATGAVALSNVALDVPGQIRTRDGYYKLATTSTAAKHVHVLDTNALTHFVTSSTTKLEAFSFGGTSVATVVATGPHSMCTYGSTGAPVVYTTSSGDASVRKYDGTAWSVVATRNAGRAITVTGDSNRLVIAAATNTHRVEFSDAGAPETFTSTSWVELTPGDGEQITNAVAWQGQLFVFKWSKFFVFYGESTSGSGTPVFNYRTVEGIGAFAGPRGAVATPQGVYFIAQGGIYLTTGGIPVKVSEPLATLFGNTSGALAFGTEVNLTWHRGRLIVVLTDTTNGPFVYVWDQATGRWSQWSLFTGKAGGTFAGHPRSAILYFVNGTDSAIYAHSAASIRDGDSGILASDGAVINWSWTSGLYSPAGDPGRITMTLESKLIGSGAATLQVATTGGGGSSSGAFDTGSSVTLGTAPAVADGWQQIDREGAYFQHKLSGSGAATINALTHYISFVAPAGSW